jgi:hypothetical protein
VKTKRPERPPVVVYETPEALFLQPDDYEDFRRFLNRQPARVKDSRGAHYEKA